MSLFRINRMELAGSLGDLGTLLPITMGMIMLNGLSPLGVFFTIGLFYIVAGWYYRVPIAVQPMKVVGAYAIATGVSSTEVQAASILIALCLAVLGATNLIEKLAKITPKPVIRGVQVSTGLLLAIKGFGFIGGTSTFQKIHAAAEPFLVTQSLLGIPIGVLIGIAFLLLTLRYLDNRTFPAGLIVVAGGLLLGLVLGTREGLGLLTLRLHLPEFMPYGWPSIADLSVAFLAMVVPQMPMTVGNAVIANADLSKQYFPESASRMTNRSLCLSMAAANAASFLFGGIPMCHGAGGLAAHYRFGARTAGSNVIIGVLFLALALGFGHGAMTLIHLIPLAVLGVLLVFAGLQLCMTMQDVAAQPDARTGLFIVFTVVALALTFNLAWGFGAGIALSWAMQRWHLKV